MKVLKDIVSGFI